ncbi:GTPase [uncultured Eudoraea sp.]|uniref:GTPase n=1 Tax=uncultured Eudoraea sp. TaxID=1035614 RepID=UPI0026241EA1|nr:GTPase [uncultured Eudoraea sp.]
MKEDIKGKLIFIYNANSGMKNSILDAAHKALSPNTYQCNLCDLTFDVFNEKKRWKQFREQEDWHMEFLHKDEYSKLYASKFGYKFKFPIVLLAVNEELQVFITTKELNELENTEALIDLIKKRSKALTA